MASQTKLGELLSPLSEDDFLRDVFGQAPLHVRAINRELSPLLSWQQLTEILREHRMDEHRIRLIRNGNILPVSTYLRRRSYRSGGQYFRVNLNGLERELRNGAVLNLVAVDEMCKPVGDMARSLEASLGGFVAAGVYAAVVPARGLNIHSDDHDVFVVHLDGKKRWQLFASPENDPTQMRNQRPVWEYVLEKGDVLYIPEGLRHSVETQVAPSLHLTFAITHRRTVDFIIWLNRKHGFLQTKFRQPLTSKAKTGILNDVRRQFVNLCNERMLEEYLHEEYSLLGKEDFFTVFPTESETQTQPQ